MCWMKLQELICSHCPMKCLAGCISAYLLGKFFLGRSSSDLVGRLRCSPLDTCVFWIGFAYLSDHTGPEVYELSMLMFI